MEKERKLEVLIIEDNPGDRRLLEMYLTNLKSYHFVTEKTLADGISALEKEPFDIVILDLDLPDSQGLETIQVLRTEASEIPIIVLTGLQDDSTALLAIRMGAQDYLFKNHISAARIKSSIDYALQRQATILSLREQSLSDELTGLHNRRGFFNLVRKQYRFACRHELSTYLIYIDIDQFKWINDTYGHKEGDKILSAVAEILGTVFREWDILARMGGDEFAVMVISEENEDIESAVIPRINKAVEQFNMGRTDYQLSLSIGISRFTECDRDNLEKAIKEADTKMYENKRSKQVHPPKPGGRTPAGFHSKQKVI